MMNEQCPLLYRHVAHDLMHDNGILIAPCLAPDCGGVTADVDLAAKLRKLDHAIDDDAGLGAPLRLERWLWHALARCTA
jgi:hypothetical protein